MAGVLAEYSHPFGSHDLSPFFDRSAADQPWRSLHGLQIKPRHPESQPVALFECGTYQGRLRQGRVVHRFQVYSMVLARRVLELELFQHPAKPGIHPIQPL